MSHYLNKSKVQTSPVADNATAAVQDRLARVVAKEYTASPPRVLKPPIG